MFNDRDYSHPSEAAKLRIQGATRLHCEESYDYENDEMATKIAERRLARGSESDEDVCDTFNQHLRAGHEHIRR